MPTSVCSALVLSSESKARASLALSRTFGVNLRTRIPPSTRRSYPISLGVQPPENSQLLPGSGAGFNDPDTLSVGRAPRRRTARLGGPETEDRG